MILKTFLSAAVLLLCTLTVPAHAQRGGRVPASMTGDILKLVNKHRTSMGLKPLVSNDLIIKEAEKHSKNMASGKVSFGHDGFDDRMARLLKTIRGAHACAENVAEGSRTAEAVVDMWLHSPGHRKNIEGNYGLTGIGIATSGDGTLYFTQIFIKN